MTQIFLNCLQWRRCDIRDAVGEGKHAVADNAALHHAQQYHAFGRQAGLSEAEAAVDLMQAYKMISKEELPNAH